MLAKWKAVGSSMGSPFGDIGCIGMGERGTGDSGGGDGYKPGEDVGGKKMRGGCFLDRSLPF